MVMLNDGNCEELLHCKSQSHLSTKRQRFTFEGLTAR